MSTYLVNFGPPPDASVVAAPPSVAAVDPAPPIADDPPVVSTAVSLRQPSLSDFWSSP